MPNVTAEEFLTHHGIKGMHWGVRKSRAELESKAAEHTTKAEQNEAGAEQIRKDHDDLLKNGVNSKPFKNLYGPNAANEGEWGFYGRTGTTKAEALTKTSNDLRMIHNQYARTANHHRKAAARLTSKAAEATHSGFAIVDEPDLILEHFGRKGMKWGEHIFGDSKSDSAEPVAAAKTPRSSADAARATKISTKASSGTHTLSNAELKDLVTRMNLEQQYSKLNTEPEQAKKTKDGKNFVEKYNKNVETGIKAVKVTHEAVKIAKVIGPIIVAAVVLANARKGGQTHNGHSVVPGSVIKD